MPIDPNELPKRLPLVVEQDNRSTTPTKDARLVNCYLETSPDGSYHVIKRPGALTASLYTVIPGTARGVFWWRGNIYMILNSTFYQLNNTGTILTALGAVDATAGLPYFFNSNLAATPTLCFSNTIVSYAYNTTIGLVTMASLGGVQPPSSAVGMVPGFCFLNGTMYYMNSAAYIFGSGINNFGVWDTTNSIVAQIEPDFGVAVAKHLVYLIAFKQWSTEVFFDNGNPTGSPLQSNPGSKINYGCASADSIQEIDGKLFWISQTKNGAVQVCKLDNMVCSVVSTPAIEKLIAPNVLSNGNDYATVYAWSYKGEGHCFYVLTIVDLNITLVYDLDEEVWHQWADSNGNYIPAIDSFFSSGYTFVLHPTNGKIYSYRGVTYQDDGVNFPVDIYTPNFDAGIDRRKMITLLRFNGDQTPGCVLQVRCNDHAYTTTAWTNYRRVDMNSQRPLLTNCGSFYRRAYHIRHLANTPLRLNSIDVSMEIGSL